MKSVDLRSQHDGHLAELAQITRTHRQDAKKLVSITPLSSGLHKIVHLPPRLHVMLVAYGDIYDSVCLRSSHDLYVL